MTSSVGLVGLAVMGQNLALNIADKGFPISVWNRTASKTDQTVQRAKDEGNLPLTGYHDLKEFVASLEVPRKIIILIQAGKAVDDAIDMLEPLLAPGDLIVDGGNELYTNTERRVQRLASKNILYMGMGVSGGEEGARHGPSLMPGGSQEGYEMMKPILLKIAAQVDDGPCVTYIGPGGSGNYVKMVHNGIEYGDMQLIAEAYAILKAAGLTNEELQRTFEEWNQGELQSFLIEITAAIFKKKDDLGTDAHLVDVILDKAGSKGTGMWTVQQAAERGVSIPTIAAALDSRYVSAGKDQRVSLSKVFASVEASVAPQRLAADKAALVNDVRQALYAAKICSYTQGLSLLKSVSDKEQWNLQLGQIARIWKGGCIIRAVFLDTIKQAFERSADLPSLLFDTEFSSRIIERQGAMRRVAGIAVSAGVPCPAFTASLMWFDMVRSERLPLNLTQAQRDFFGAHTYERVDRAGVFHSEWNQ
eukprot:GILI01005776.1.p2 GENE.GILI01005776.1~~GILI01005776.1.p2  ORF type:complete len:512 (+),score=176.01 GILI01005776.1:109-1536(+)